MFRGRIGEPSSFGAEEGLGYGGSPSPSSFFGYTIPMRTVDGEYRVDIPEPSFDDFELAIRSMTGAKLKAEEERRLDTPELIEARHRVENCMQSQVAAARASLLALSGKAVAALGELLESDSPKIQLGAVKLWSGLALPADPIDVRHTHQLGGEERALAGQAAADFSRLTSELTQKLSAARVIDISASPHLLRGEDARPSPMPLEKPKGAVPR